MAKTNKQLQKEIDKLTIERNNLIDTVEILEKGTRQIAKILGLDGISETTYLNDADFECIEKAIEKLQGKYEKCFEELSMKCGECEGLIKANETIVKAHNDLEHENKRLSDLLHLYDNKDWKEHCEEQKIKELELDKKDLHKRLIEGLQINIEKVEKIGELENENKRLEKENKRLKEKGTRCRVEMVKREMENKKLEEKYEKCFEELSTKLSEESDLDIIRAENEVIKQDKANLLAELTRQINEKSALKKENKRLKKRRRTGRYNIDKFITNLTKGAYIYVEGASRPTKLHKRLTDAIAEKQRLEDKTGKKVYILTNL